MKLYVAGPCTSQPDHNFPAFAAATDALAAAGHDPVNPTRRGVVDGYGWADYMRAALADLLGCDGVALLPGWSESPGARLEGYVAHALNMPVQLVDAWLAEAVPW